MIDFTLMTPRNDTPPSDLEPAPGTLQSYLLAAMRNISEARTVEGWSRAIDGHNTHSTRMLISDLVLRGQKIETARVDGRSVYRLSEKSVDLHPRASLSGKSD